LRKRQAPDGDAATANDEDTAAATAPLAAKRQKAVPPSNPSAPPAANNRKFSVVEADADVDTATYADAVTRSTKEKLVLVIGRYKDNLYFDSKETVDD